MRNTTLPLSLGVALLAGSGLVGTQAQDLPQIDSPIPCDGWTVSSDGQLYRGSGPVTLQQLVESSAPILWFSPDEPLLTNGRELPQVLPFDERPTGRATVYYSVHTVLVRPGREEFVTRALAHGDLLLKDVVSIDIVYYFYYEFDIGFSSHLHDLERVRVSLFVDDAFTIRVDDGPVVRSMDSVIVE